MSNLPLQPLVWYDRENYAGTKSPLHHYDIYRESHDKFCVSYQPINGSTREATGFATIDDAKTWCWNHYNEKMQPYVKPAPTWIDVNQREPTEKGDYLIRDYQGRVAMGKYDKGGFYMESGGEKWGCVQYWMPIPEFKQGE